MGSNNTIKILKEIYPNNNLIDGSILIEHIENNKNYNILIKELNNNIKYNSNLILACTHFIELNEDDFIIPIIKNS